MELKSIAITLLRSIKNYDTNGYKSYYRKAISDHIVGLKKAFTSVLIGGIRKKMLTIAGLLAKSYQVGNKSFLHHYLTCQNRLKNIRNKVSENIKSELEGKELFLDEYFDDWLDDHSDSSGSIF